MNVTSANGLKLFNFTVTLISSNNITSSSLENKIMTVSLYPPSNALLVIINMNVPNYLRNVYILIALFGIVGNFFVFSVLLKNFSKLASITESLLLHQSVVDELTSLFVILTAFFPPPLTYPTSPNLWDELLCRVWATQLPMFTCFSTSCYNLVAITFEQYFEIVHPLFHKTHLRNMHRYIPVGLVWFFSIACNTAAYVPDTAIVDNCCLAWAVFPNAAATIATGIAVLMYYLIIPAATVIGCFCHMTYVLHKKSSQTAPVGIKSTFGNAKLNVLKTLALFICALIICWTYNITVFSLAFFNAIEETFFTTWKYHVSVLMLFLSSAINPFIYAFNYKKFRKSLRQCFSKCLKQSAFNDTTQHVGIEDISCRKY